MGADSPTSSKTGQVERASAWIYTGLWAVLTRLFLVPREPPHMPAGAHEIIGSFRPSPGYLRYVKLYFWIGLSVIDIALTLLLIGLMVSVPFVGALLALPILIIIVLPDILAYIAIHLRYDTTWYVLTDRSMRLRRGVLVLTEVTITYENVQNVAVQQGPVQRYFGIADLVVHTAGGGGGGPGGKHGGGLAGGHEGRIEGVDNAHAIRDMIMARAKASRSAGLGDEHAANAEASVAPSRLVASNWTPAHISSLRMIRDLLPVSPERASP